VSETATPPGAAGHRGSARFRFGALIAIVAIVGVVVWLAVGRDNSSTSTSSSNGVLVSPRGLRTLASTLNQPIFWVGADKHVTYELTRPDNGRILLGYVPSGQSDSKPHVTVATYPITNAYAVTQSAAQKKTTVRVDVGGGAVAFYDKRYPLSTFISYPGSGYQIEVYAPAPGQSRRLVGSGKVEPVPGSPPDTTAAVAVTPQGLSNRAAAEKQPIYWAGPLHKYTYELTKTSQRWFLLRYLPSGAPVGSAGEYLTIGTYPVANAFAAVQRLSREKGAVTIKLKDGGLAVVNPHHFPRSVFVAYQGSNYQVEVFAPRLALAKRLVTSGRITAVS
jgi:hypothetical protein